MSLNAGIVGALSKANDATAHFPGVGGFRRRVPECEASHRSDHVSVSLFVS